MPSLKDSYFARSLTYIVEHNENGAMGIVINQPSNLTFKEVMEQTDESALVENINNDKIVLRGGPVHTDRGFVLHSSEGDWSSSIRINSDVTVTTSKDILSVLGNDAGPSKSMLALGYAGWDAGQLEEELQNNSWLTVEADSSILFDVPFEDKWQAAVNKLGIDVWQLTQHGGHA